MLSAAPARARRGFTYQILSKPLHELLVTRNARIRPGESADLTLDLHVGLRDDAAISLS